MEAQGSKSNGSTRLDMSPRTRCIYDSGQNFPKHCLPDSVGRRAILLQARECFSVAGTSQRVVLGTEQFVSALQRAMQVNTTSQNPELRILSIARGPKLNEQGHAHQVLGCATWHKSQHWIERWRAAKSSFERSG